MREVLTPEEARRVVDEIRAFQQRNHYQDLESWWVVSMEQLYQLTEECYLVRYANNVQSVWVRYEDGVLRPAATFTLRTPTFLHPSQHKKEEAL